MEDITQLDLSSLVSMTVVPVYATKDTWHVATQAAVSIDI